MPPRVVFVNRYFHPDHSATSQMVSDLAFHLAQRGFDVAAIASRQRYDDPRARLVPGAERGVAVDRVWSTRFGRGGLIGRAIDYATFYASAFFALLRHARRDTTIVAMTDPPLISVVAAFAAKLRGATLVNWVQDLFPDVAEALGMRMPRTLRTLRDWSLRRARANVVLGERMAERVPNAVVQHNWATAGLRPVAPDDNALREWWDLGDAFVVEYSGNLGRAHEFETVLGAMHLLQNDPRIRFLIIGAGAQLEAVRRRAPKNVVFQPYQPRERLSESLSAGDVHLVSLQPSLEGLIVPSKVYGVLAVGRPVISIGDPDGEVARLIRDCGLVVAPGDSAGLAAAIRKLAADRDEAHALGARGRALYESRFAPPKALANWEALLGFRLPVSGFRDDAPRQPETGNRKPPPS